VELTVGAKGHTFEEIAAMRANAREEMFKAMRKGSSFTMYPDNGPEQVVDLWLVDDDHRDPAGCVYWGPVGLRDQAAVKSMPIPSILDLYFGKQGMAFQKCAGSHDRCFSLLNADMVLNLEADSPRTLQIWLQGIHYLIITKAKKEIIHHKNGGEDATAAVHALFGVNGEKPRTTQNPLAALVAGTACVFKSEGGQEDQAMWLVPESGTIFWGARDSRNPDVRRCMRINQITELLVGKLAPVFKSNHGKQVSSRRCLTLKSVERELNVEFATHRGLLEWLAGLQHMLQKAGAQVVC
jgi:hypothetical protein